MRSNVIWNARRQAALKANEDGFAAHFRRPGLGYVWERHSFRHASRASVKCACLTIAAPFGQARAHKDVDALADAWMRKRIAEEHGFNRQMQ